MRRDDAGDRAAAEHVSWLDGLRGLAAFWVLASHVQILVGMRIVFLLSYGGLAVDLFMMLSGFLMAHHYILRRDREPWEAKRSWVLFWTRRFFRIAPLYYVLLCAALAVGPYVGEMREAIAQAWPATATVGSRYADQSLGNVIAHASFVFGMLPGYAFETPLPDWSIGLEMEFYASFPLLMLLMSRLGAQRAALIAVASCLMLQLAFAGFFQRFAMPSLLPMKLYMFCAGMLIAEGRGSRRGMSRGLLTAVALSLPYLALLPNREATLRVLMILALFYLMTDGSLPSFRQLDRGMAQLRRALGGRLGRLLGDTSYATYLLHLLVLIPLAGALAGHELYLRQPAWARFALCLAIVASIVYPAAWLLHRWIEQPGIRLGKRVIARMPRARAAAGAAIASES
jgi:peptidoglycan/LPS O-acetylase OafA/YrhL